MRIGKFLTVGVGNTILTIVVFNLLVARGSSAAFANFVGYSIGIVNSFFWNRRWTFADRPVESERAAFVRFAVVIGLSLLLTTAVVAALERFAVNALAPLGVSRLLAVNLVEGLAVLVGLVWNYVLSAKWVFVGDRQ